MQIYVCTHLEFSSTKKRKSAKPTLLVQINALDHMDFLSFFFFFLYTCFPLRVLSKFIFEWGKIVLVTKIGSISISRQVSALQYSGR